MKEFKSSLAGIFKQALDSRLSRGQGVDYHRNALMCFDEYCSAMFPTATTITDEMVFGWPEYERSVGRGGGMRQKMMAVRDVGRILVTTGVQSYIIPSNLIPRQGKSKIPYIMTDMELSDFFKVLDSDRLCRRFDKTLLMSARVLFRLLYTCGLRPGEGTQLRIRDVNKDEGTVLVSNNKTRRERIVALSDDMRDLLSSHINLIRSIFPKSEYVFVDSRGNVPCILRFRKLLQKCWRESHGGKCDSAIPRLRLYDFRHRFASTVMQKWNDDGKDAFRMIPYLRAYLGHCDFNSSLYYVHILPDGILASKGIDWAKANKPIPEA